jgi:hypothetical protein
MNGNPRENNGANVARDDENWKPAGQYFVKFSDADITELEKETLAKGEIVDQGNNIYFVHYRFPFDIGYTAPTGMITNRIRTVWNNGYVHSYPCEGDCEEDE